MRIRESHLRALIRESIEEMEVYPQVDDDVDVRQKLCDVARRAGLGNNCQVIRFEGEDFAVIDTFSSDDAIGSGPASEMTDYYDCIDYLGNEKVVPKREVEGICTLAEYEDGEDPLEGEGGDDWHDEDEPDEDY